MGSVIFPYAGWSNARFPILTLSRVIGNMCFYVGQRLSSVQPIVFIGADLIWAITSSRMAMALFLCHIAHLEEGIDGGLLLGWSMKGNGVGSGKVEEVGWFGLIPGSGLECFKFFALLGLELFFSQDGLVSLAFFFFVPSTWFD